MSFIPLLQAASNASSTQSFGSLIVTVVLMIGIFYFFNKVNISFRSIVSKRIITSSIIKRTCYSKSIFFFRKNIKLGENDSLFFL